MAREIRYTLSAKSLLCHGPLEFEEDMGKQIDHLIAAKLKPVRDAFSKISTLNPVKDTEYGVYDEWGEAECFRLAQDAAKDALALLVEDE